MFHNSNFLFAQPPGSDAPLPPGNSDSVHVGHCVVHLVRQHNGSHLRGPLHRKRHAIENPHEQVPRVNGQTALARPIRCFSTHGQWQPVAFDLVGQGTVRRALVAQLNYDAIHQFRDVPDVLRMQCSVTKPTLSPLRVRSGKIA